MPAITQQIISAEKEYGKHDGKLTVIPMNKPIERPRSHMASGCCVKSNHLRLCRHIIYYLFNDDKAVRLNASCELKEEK